MAMLRVIEEDHVAALIALAEAGIPFDVQELLVNGDADRGIAPGALLKALTAASAARSLPDGFVRVPREPTPEMVTAYRKAGSNSNFRAGYNAMLSVAPSPEEYKCPKCGAEADERWDCCEVHAMTAKAAPQLGWVKGLEDAPYASTVLAAYFDDSDGEWVMELFVAERPRDPFTHYMIVTRPGEKVPTFYPTATNWCSMSDLPKLDHGYKIIGCYDDEAGQEVVHPLYYSIWDYKWRRKLDGVEVNYPKAWMPYPSPYVDQSAAPVETSAIVEVTT